MVIKKSFIEYEDEMLEFKYELKYPDSYLDLKTIYDALYPKDTNINLFHLLHTP